MEKYHSFEELPVEVAEKLRKEIVLGEKRVCPRISKNATLQERMRAISEATKNPNYADEQLTQIVDAFTLFNNAVKRGLPNQLYQMFVKTLDSEIAKRAYAAHAIWYAYEGGELAKDAVQEFADRLKAEIDKRAGWTEKQFHKEYFLNRR